MKTTWTKNIDIPERPHFVGEAKCDVVIIGAGMAGSLIAYMLAKAGKKVLVVDKGIQLDNAVTPYTTGWLSSDVDTDLADLTSMFDAHRANDVWRSHADAIDAIEKIITTENIDCDFMRVPEYWYATSDKGFDTLLDEAREGRGAGFTIDEVPRQDMTFKNYGVLSLQHQAKFHPMKFLLALQEKAIALGAQFYDVSEVETIEGDMPVIVRLKNAATIQAQYAVVATYLSIENPPSIFAKKGKYLSYVYELDIPKNSLPEALYLDDENPYHYFRIDTGQGEYKGDRMVFGGEDHREELPVDEDKQFAALKQHLADYFPDLSYTIVRKWSGLILETLDGLPYIGAPSDKRPHLLVATGFSGNGMTYSMTSASILTDMITGNKNKYTDIFSPHREFSFKGILYKSRDYLEEFVEGYMKNLFQSTDT